MLSEEWITKQLGFLSYRIGLYKLHSGPSFFFEPTLDFYSLLGSGDTKALNRAIQLLAKHIELDSAPVVEAWRDLPNPIVSEDQEWQEGEGQAGIIYNGRIKVDIAHKYSPKVMGATLAHELTHYFLDKRQIRYSDTEENERLTDFATVFLGLGKLIINGYEELQWFAKSKGKPVLRMHRVGYLEQSEIAEAMVRVCSFRGISIEKAFTNLTDQSLELLKTAEYRRLANKDHVDTGGGTFKKISLDGIMGWWRNHRQKPKHPNGGSLAWFAVCFFGLPFLCFVISIILQPTETNLNKEVWKALRQIRYECLNEQILKLSNGYLKMADTLQADIEQSLRLGVPEPDISAYFEPVSERCRFVCDDLSICLDSPANCPVEYYHQRLTSLGFTLPPLYRD